MPRGQASDVAAILVASESFATQVDGQDYVGVKGQTRVRADHPLARACPQYFEPADQSVTYDMEQATAAPGERRGERRPKVA